MDNKSLTHTKWECKYHLVFAPKYRRQVIYGKIKADIGRILRELCERNGVEIIEIEYCFYIKITNFTLAIYPFVCPIMFT